MNTHELITAIDAINEADTALFHSALATRGKNKGMLKAKAPKWGTPAWVAWQALVMEVAPFRASVGGLMMLDGEQKDEWTRLSNLMDKVGMSVLLVLSEPQMRWNLREMQWRDDARDKLPKMVAFTNLHVAEKAGEE